MFELQQLFLKCLRNMATFHWQDNLSSTAFTPRDFQVELLAASSEQNIIICLGHNSSKEFIALKLLLEKSNELRSSPNNDYVHKVTIILTATSTGGVSMYNLIFHLTDLKVLNANENEVNNWNNVLDDYQVIILNITKCLDAVEAGDIELSRINLIVIEDCHKTYSNDELVQLLRGVQNAGRMPKILGLAGPLHSAGCSTDQLAFHLEVLEKTIHCKAETASDIVTVLR